MLPAWQDVKVVGQVLSVAIITGAVGGAGFAVRGPLRADNWSVFFKNMCAHHDECFYI